MNSKRSLTFQYTLGAALVSIVAIFYCLILKFSINIPWFDDIENIPYFLVKWIEAPTVTAKWQAIIHPNNEHRVLAARLIVLGQYFLTGGLNFKHLLFCGNLSVLALFGLIASAYLRQGGKWYMTVPVAFFIFNLQSYSGTFMTIMSMQYQMVIFLSVASFYCLAKQNSYALALAILLGCVDTFSMGNGMMVWPSGLVLLLFQVRWRDAVLWILAAVISVFFYFYGYDFVQGNDKAFAYILANPFSTFIAFFTMLGGDFDVIAQVDFTKRMIIPTIAGGILFSVFIIWFIGLLSSSPFWGKWIPGKWSIRFSGLIRAHGDNDRWNAFWLATMLYVMIGMLLVVVFRTRFDPHIILWSTYKMYPAVLTSVIYIVVIQSSGVENESSFFLRMVFVSLLVWASTLINYLPVIEETSEVRTAFAFNQKRNGIGLGAMAGTPFETMLDTTLKRVEQMGIYALPAPIIHMNENKIHLPDSSEAMAEVEIRDLDAGILGITPVSKILENGRKFAVFQSAANLYLFAIPSDTRGAICPKATLRKGRYKIGIWIVSKDLTTLLSTGRNVVIE